jgi:uncharacterized membrane protein
MIMAIPCPQCKTELPDNAAFCPFCGLRIFIARPDQPRNFHDNLLGALAYVTVIPAIVFLLMGRLKRNAFVRFHSLQSIFLAIAGVLVVIAVRFAFSLFVLVPRIGFLIAWLSVAIVFLGWLILWIVVIVKALQGESFKLPIIGSLADQA